MRSQPFYTPKKLRISLTALIDVVFILLLFFMLTTSFNHRYAIDMSTASASQQEAKVKVVTLLIHKEKQIELYKQKKIVSDFKQLKLPDLSIGAIGSEAQPVVLPHASVPLQVLLDVMAHLEKIGVKNASIGHAFNDALFGEQAP